MTNEEFLSDAVHDLHNVPNAEEIDWSDAETLSSKEFWDFSKNQILVGWFVKEDRPEFLEDDADPLLVFKTLEGVEYWVNPAWAINNALNQPSHVEGSGKNQRTVPMKENTNHLYRISFEGQTSKGGKKFNNFQVRVKRSK